MFSDVSVHPIDSHEVYKEVMEAATADGHGPYMPTHYVMKNGIVIGAFSTQSPTVHWWMSEKHASRKDSLLAFQSLDTLMTNLNCSEYLIPCEPESPYYDLMNKRLPDAHEGTTGGHWKLFRRKL
tara:strand:+ start:1309 stop:1683 length:375 start_codon:yes stop_codon:yes gene_type:complete